MRRVLLFACCVFVVLPLFAASSDAPPRMATAGEFRHPLDLPAMDKTFAEALREVRIATTAAVPRVGPNVVLEGAEPGFVIPIAGSGPGGGGTFFRSEAVVINRRAIAQNVIFFFFPIGGGAANCTRAGVIKRLDANTWYLYTDLVSDIFGVSGFGAVIAFPVGAAGNYDANALIDGNARIWSPEPGTTGTTSQNFPSMSLAMPVGTGAQSTWGLRLDEFYRSNWGVFNYDTNVRAFDISVDGLRGQFTTTVVIDACSLVQSAIPGGPYGSFQLTITPHDNKASYFTYGSSVDNTTGDAWSVTGRSF
jgi:hypothetical protein